MLVWKRRGNRARGSLKSGQEGRNTEFLSWSSARNHYLLGDGHIMPTTYWGQSSSLKAAPQAGFSLFDTPSCYVCSGNIRVGPGHVKASGTARTRT
jgi:hypothetical protein